MDSDYFQGYALLSFDPEYAVTSNRDFKLKDGAEIGVLPGETKTEIYCLAGAVEPEKRFARVFIRSCLNDHNDPYLDVCITGLLGNKITIQHYSPNNLRSGLEETFERKVVEHKTVEREIAEGETSEKETAEREATKGETAEGATIEGATAEGETIEGETVEEGDTDDGLTIEGEDTAVLQHNDQVKIINDDDLVASFRISLEHIVRRQIMVPSSNIRTQDQFYTPQVASNFASVIDETPAHDRFGEREISEIADTDGDVVSPPRSATETPFIDDSETESESEAEVPYHSSEKPAIDVSSHSSNKRPLEEDNEEVDVETKDEPEPKRVKPEISIPERRGRGRPKKSPNTIATPNLSLDAEKSATPTPAPGPDALESPTSLETPRSRNKRKPIIVFSGSTHTKHDFTVKYLKRYAQIAEEVSADTDFLCIGNGKLKTTSKILKAVVLGKPIIDDSWVTSCMKTKEEDGLVDHTSYVAKDSAVETANHVPPSWSSGTGTRKIFDGKSVHITPALKRHYGSSWSDIKFLLDTLGASRVTTYAATAIAKSIKAEPDVVIIGNDSHDNDVAALLEKDITVFGKELIPWSILRGQFYPKSNEFQLLPTISASKPKKEKGSSKK